MSLKKRYWIVAMDGAQARIFEREGKFTPLHQIHHFSKDHELTHTHGPDKPGRTFESATMERHAYAPKHDWHETQKHLFVGEVAKKIGQAYHQKYFERLILVCPAHLINDLKIAVEASVSKEERKNLRHDVIAVSKDLTHHSLEEVQKHIDELA